MKKTKNKKSISPTTIIKEALSKNPMTIKEIISYFDTEYDIQIFLPADIRRYLLKMHSRGEVKVESINNTTLWSNIK